MVATTGEGSLASGLRGSVPANARVESFLSYHHLLPHVDVMVTNAGYGECRLVVVCRDFAVKVRAAFYHGNEAIFDRAVDAVLGTPGHDIVGIGDLCRLSDYAKLVR